jgi:hypothetical protein
MAGDEQLGTLADAVLDVLDWRLRYLVVELGERPALLIPDTLSLPATGESLRLTLSREQLTSSPAIAEAGLTRDYETALQEHYGWNLYPIDLETDIDEAVADAAIKHLQRFGTIRGHVLRSPDGRAGRLDDFIVNDENWALFFMVVETGGVLEGNKQVLLPPSWVGAIADGELTVELSKETVQKSRPYEPERLNDE